MVGKLSEHACGVFELLHLATRSIYLPRAELFELRHLKREDVI